MAKYNTNTIKEYFTNYLSSHRNELFDDLAFCYCRNPKKVTLNSDDLKTIAEFAKFFKCKNDPIEVANCFYNEFINPKRWVRHNKEKFETDEIDVDFCVDVCGEINKDLISKLNSTDLLICRTFYPKSEQLSDNYRLEFTTLADDSDFIFWTIIVD